MFQNTKNTSLPNSMKDRNMKITKIIRNFWRFDSVASSVLPELGPPETPPGLFEPKMSSQVKLRVNKAGNKPKPITNPPLEFPNIGFPIPRPLLKF